MNTAEMEGEWEGLKGKIQAKWQEGTPDGLGVTAGHREMLDGELHRLFEMTLEQAKNAIAGLDESKRS